MDLRILGPDFCQKRRTARTGNLAPEISGRRPEISGPPEISGQRAEISVLPSSFSLSIWLTSIVFECLFQVFHVRSFRITNKDANTTTLKQSFDTINHRKL
jgi:hypothetical protein